jgi:hypothetical protein
VIGVQVGAEDPVEVGKREKSAALERRQPVEGSWPWIDEQSASGDLHKEPAGAAREHAKTATERAKKRDLERISLRPLDPLRDTQLQPLVEVVPFGKDL